MGLILRRLRAADAALADRVALLSERVRSGSIEPWRLEIAAYVGDVAAATIVGEVSRANGLKAWLRGFARWGQSAVVRAALSVSDLGLKSATRHGKIGTPLLPALEAAQAAGEAWLLSPLAERTSALRDHCESLEQEVRRQELFIERNVDWGGGDAAALARFEELQRPVGFARAVIHAIRAACVEPHPKTPYSAIPRYVSRAAATHAVRSFESLCEFGDIQEAEVRAHVESLVLKWARIGLPG